MTPQLKKTRWLLAPIAGVVAVGGLLVSGSLSSAQTPGPATTETPAANESAEPKTYEDFLAEELDISVEELREASENAQDRYIDEMAEAGIVTPDQADHLKEWNPAEHVQRLMERIDLSQVADLKQFVVAQIAAVLDMEPEALEADLAEGRSFREIAEEQDLSDEDLVTGIQSRVDEIVDGAVDFGLISEDKGEWLKEKAGEVIDAVAGFLIESHEADQNR